MKAPVFDTPPPPHTWNIDYSEIEKIDGDGDKTFIGRGQPLTILKIRNGHGSTWLNNFGDISMPEKNGEGSLYIKSAASVDFTDVIDGTGNTDIDNRGRVYIHRKNGDGVLRIAGASSAHIENLSGNGHTYLMFKGPKTIGEKHDGGLVHYIGQAPVIGNRSAGASQLVDESSQIEASK